MDNISVKKESPQITLILAHLSSIEQIKKTINSIKEQDYENLQVILVCTQEYYQEEIKPLIPPSWKLILYPGSANLLALYNTALQSAIQSSSDYFCLVQSGSTLAANWLKKLIAFMMMQKTVGLVSGLVVENFSPTASDGQSKPINSKYFGLSMNTIGWHWRKSAGEELSGSDALLSSSGGFWEVTGVTGEAVILRPELVEQEGFFNQEFSSEAGFLDYCLRALRYLGFRSVIYPSVEVTVDSEKISPFFNYKELVEDLKYRTDAYRLAFRNLPFTLLFLFPLLNTFSKLSIILQFFSFKALAREITFTIKTWLLLPKLLKDRFKRTFKFKLHPPQLQGRAIDPNFNDLLSHDLQPTFTDYSDQKTLKPNLPDKISLPDPASKVAVIVLNWNGLEHLQTCFTSLNKLTYPAIELILVDNASTDGSSEFVKKKFPQVNIIQNEKNLGFAEGNNIGLRYALAQGYKYAVLLNNDTSVEPDWISWLVTAAESDPAIAACASRMLIYDNPALINSIGITLNHLGFAWDKGMGRLDSPIFEKPQYVAGACGGTFFVRLSAISKVGLLDPSYFIFFEDLDLSFRLWKAGYKIVYVPQAVIRHKFSATMGHGKALSRKDFLMERNRFRFVARFFPAQNLLALFPELLLYELDTIRRLLRTGEKARAWVQIKALSRFFIEIPCLLFQRRKYKGSLPETLQNLFEKGNFSRPNFYKWIPDSLPLERLFDECKDQAQIQERLEDPLDSRIIMGVNDSLTGLGWFPLEIGVPNFRWMAKKATMLLKPKLIASSIGVNYGSSGVLQLHACHPFHWLENPTLSVKLRFLDQNLQVIEESKIGSCEIIADWKTYHFPINKFYSDLVLVILELDKIFYAEQTKDVRDLGIMVNEISILDSNSNQIREEVLHVNTSKNSGD